MNAGAAGRKSGIPFLALLCWLVFSSFYLPWPKQQPERLSEQARVAYTAGDYRSASSMAQAALTLWQKPPRSNFEAIAGALVLLGNIFMESGDPDGAYQQYYVAYALAAAKCGPRHPATADALNGLGEYYYRRSEPGRAEDYFRQALYIRRDAFGMAHEKVAASLNNIGNCYASAGRYMEALEMHREALNLRRAVLKTGHPDIAVSLSNFGNCLYLSGDVEGALRNLEQALALRMEALGPGHPKTAALHNSIGNCHAALGRHDDALRHYETALHGSLSTLGKEHPTVASIWENIADLHFDRGDYILAMDRFRQAWNIQARVFGEASVPAMTLQHKIGLCHQYKGEYETAWEKHQSALAVLGDALGPDHRLTGALHNNLGNCLTGLKNYPGALAHYRSALQTFRRGAPASDAETVTTLHNMGAALLQSGDADAALSAFTASENHFPPEDRAAMAVCFKNKAMAAIELRRFPLADSLARAAMRLLPDCPPALQTELRLANGLLRLQMARNSPDIQLMEKAAGALDTALQYAELSMRQLSGSEARAYGLAQHLPTLRAAVEAFFLLYERSKDRRYLHRAYELSEVDKNLQWSEMSRRDLLESSSEIPDSVRRQERELSAGINRLEKERLLLNDPIQIHSLDLRLAELREQLRAFVNRAVEAYPGYPSLQFSIQAPSLDFLQTRLLDKNQAIVKYFDADSLWLVFVITKEEAAGLRLPKSENFNRKVSAFRQSLQGYIGAPMQSADSMAGLYVAYGTGLYSELVQPLASSPAGAKSHWVLIPDGAAAYLPFEALLSEQPSEPLQFKSHAYLLKQRQTAYAYSVVHWAMLEQARPLRKGKRMAAFAPDFSLHPAGLPPLRHSETELRAAAALFNGRLFTGADAGTADFTKEAGHYRVLLLATHGKAGRTIGDMSYLAFTHVPEDDAAPVIYTRDLYAMRIPAELVVLSACETSVGEYRAGQGVISLGKGFFQAGARSVVATLWSVDDARHADLMVRFYKNLKAKQRKDDALRQAKLDYIAGHPHDEAHPAYWAGSTAWGNMRPLPEGRRQNLLYVLGGAFLLVAGFSWAHIRRKKK